ncbi:hypothetical protein Tco_1491574 [Tanacetum coccineum]
MFIDSTTKVDSEPPNGSNDDITNPYECNQTLYVSAGTSNSSAACASLESKNEVCLLCEVSPKANPSLQIHLCFFGEQSQPLKILGKGEEGMGGPPTLPGLLGVNEAFGEVGEFWFPYSL